MLSSMYVNSMVDLSGSRSELMKYAGILQKVTPNFNLHICYLCRTEHKNSVKK